jgi:lysophospholipase L1-like esterase
VRVRIGGYSRRVVIVVASVASALFILLGFLLANAGHDDRFYLVIGASSAKGFEPIGQLGLNGKPKEGPTSDGYANDLVSLEAARNVSLALDTVACPGEVIQTMLDGGDACYTGGNSQLALAEKFLRAHRQEAGVVTIELGFNNIRPCITFENDQSSCVPENIALIKTDLPKILDGLKKAAGPDVTFVGLQDGDPYLGHYLLGSSGQANAAMSLRTMKTLNATLNRIYEAAGMRVAPVAAALRMSDTDKSITRDGKKIPVDVATACATTWMCRALPWGPDDHPNNAGYLIIAQAVARVLAKTR